MSSSFFILFLLSFSLRDKKIFVMLLKPRRKHAPCILHLSRNHSNRWGAMVLAIPSIWFCFQILLRRRKTSTLSTQRYCSPMEGESMKNTYLGLTTIIERAKQELLPLSYRWVSPQNVWNMNVKENLFPQKIKINVFRHKITKTSQDLLYKSELCCGILPPGTCHQI